MMEPILSLGLARLWPPAAEPHATPEASVVRPAPKERPSFDSAFSAPRHLAIVQDLHEANGTGRKSVNFVAALGASIDVCLGCGVRNLTVLVSAPASLSENGCGLREEVYAALGEYLAAKGADLCRRGVSFGFLGSSDDGASALRQAVTGHAARVEATHNRPVNSESSLANPQFERLLVTLAVNYSGRAELAEAARRLGASVERGELAPEAIDAARLTDALPSASLPPVDFVIHTAGVKTLSDLLLWKAAYAELLFSDVPWTHFGSDDLKLALQDYSRRRRTFGALPPGA